MRVRVYTRVCTCVFSPLQDSHSKGWGTDSVNSTPKSGPETLTSSGPLSKLQPPSVFKCIHQDSRSAEIEDGGTQAFKKKTVYSNCLLTCFQIQLICLLCTLYDCPEHSLTCPRLILLYLQRRPLSIQSDINQLHSLAKGVLWSSLLPDKFFWITKLESLLKRWLLYLYFSGVLSI